MHQLFTSNLVTRSASAENAADADRSVADVEHTRLAAVAERQMFDPSDSTFIVLCRRYLCFQIHVIEFYNICIQGDHLSGKPGNVTEFYLCQGNVGDFTKVREVSGKKTCKGKVA